MAFSIVRQFGKLLIEYLSQYDFVPQDGEGYNYYNSDVSGDVVDGTER